MSWFCIFASAPKQTVLFGFPETGPWQAIGAQACDAPDKLLYSPNDCQDLSLSVSRISLPSVLRKGPLQHALQHLLQHAMQRCVLQRCVVPDGKKDSSLFKRPLAINLAKTVCLPQFFCVARLCCTLCCRVCCRALQGVAETAQYCHTGSAVSQKPVQHAPAIQLLAVGGSLRYVLFFCCADVAQLSLCFPLQMSWASAWCSPLTPTWQC